MTQATRQEGLDSLTLLEERIHQATSLVTQLRQERDAALREAAEAKTRHSELQREVETLRGERDQIRGRIEKLLSQIEQWGTS